MKKLTVLAQGNAAAPLTSEACRAARALLGWGVRDLAEFSGVNYVTISRIEGGSKPRPSTEKKIVDAFARQGVEITNGDGTGARLRLPRRRK